MHNDPSPSIFQRKPKWPPAGLVMAVPGVGKRLCPEPVPTIALDKECLGMKLLLKQNPWLLPQVIHQHNCEAMQLCKMFFNSNLKCWRCSGLLRALKAGTALRGWGSDTGTDCTVRSLLPCGLGLCAPAACWQYLGLGR
ncbi:hypothetical protein EK904_003773 [Melospiza melodia maxima]|nr:hypothetical protein EK904_003773 [Melospiza melodia maxima]